LIASALLAAAGCPRELQIPDASGAACTDNVDCNGGITCGPLRACVLGHCEQDASLAIPCEGGTPTDAGVIDAHTADGS